jgi:hypothetical protein
VRTQTSRSRSRSRASVMRCTTNAIVYEFRGYITTARKAKYKVHSWIRVNTHARIYTRYSQHNADNKYSISSPKCDILQTYTHKHRCKIQTQHIVATGYHAHTHTLAHLHRHKDDLFSETANFLSFYTRSYINANDIATLQQDSKRDPLHMSCIRESY